MEPRGYGIPPGKAGQPPEVLPRRFARFGLTLHPTKTRLVKFTRPPFRDPHKGGGRPGGPGSFDLLGFTHYWGRSLRGNWIVKRKTARDRLSRRSQKAYLNWARFNRLVERHPLPPSVVVHSVLR